MTSEDLRAGYKFYIPNGLQINRYEYLMPHPKKAFYHVLLDDNDKPTVEYSVNLDNMLSRSFDSYDKAELQFAKNMYEIFEDIAKRKPELFKWAESAEYLRNA